jgi:hypothetical protein
MISNDCSFSIIVWSSAWSAKSTRSLRDIRDLFFAAESLVFCLLGNSYSSVCISNTTIRKSFTPISPFLINTCSSSIYWPVTTTTLSTYCTRVLYNRCRQFCRRGTALRNLIVWKHITCAVGGESPLEVWDYGCTIARWEQGEVLRDCFVYWCKTVLYWHRISFSFCCPVSGRGWGWYLFSNWDNSIALSCLVELVDIGCACAGRAADWSTHLSVTSCSCSTHIDTLR